MMLFFDVALMLDSNLKKLQKASQLVMTAISFGSTGNWILTSMR